MSNTNELIAYFKGRVGVCESVYQHDYGRVLVLDGKDYIDPFDAYFEVQGVEEAIPAVGQENRVAIPNACLANSGKVTLHIPIHAGENDSEVEDIITFKVIGRAKPMDDGTPAEQSAIAQAIAVLKRPITFIETIVNEALSFTGTTLDEFREEINDFEDDVNTSVTNLVENVKPDTVKTLWTGLLDSDHPSASLSEAVSNFDFLDFYYVGQPDSFERVPVSKGFVKISIAGFDETSAKTLRIGEMQLTFSGSTVSVSTSKYYELDGYATYAPPTISNGFIGFVNRIDGVKVASLTPAELTDIRTGADGQIYSTAGDAVRGQVADLKGDINNDLYIHETDTDAFYWRPNARVNSQGSTYSTGQTYWTGLYKTNDPERIQLEVKAGSTFVANTGYTLDYALRANGVTKQIERGVSAGTTITIEYDGTLLLAVSDGSSATSPAENAKAVAKAGLTIDLIVKPIKTIVLQNAEDIETLTADVAELKNDERKAYSSLTELVSAQKEISDDWHFGFINVAQGMGLGSNHIIPATKSLWSESGTTDLNQKEIWMRDGVHPFKGVGVTDMYARTIAPQLAMIVPSYRDGVGTTTPSVWAGRNILWMGTSIPAGSDPEAGEGTGSTYPALVASILGATSINKSKGSSCVRINASTGTYTGMIYNHFARALSRTIAEVDNIALNWDSIKGNITYAPDTLTEANVNTMKNHSFENLLVPYLDGTYTMPDLFVLDHGHNDVRPKGIDGKNDLWIEPTVANITSGVLAEDTYMTSNNYANLKVALNDDLSGITDLASFAASLNRNCFKGAINFIITVILRYNPYARIAIVGDYN